MFGLTVSREALISTIVRNIAELIDTEQRTITNRELIACCAGIGRIESGATDPHLFHELAETALNLLVCEKYGMQLLQAANCEDACRRILRPLQARLPVQSWRSHAQLSYQQFSTPAPIAYLMAYLVNLRRSDVILEPSGGTGSLAVWGRAIGADVIVNEIDPRRREQLRLLGFTPTPHNAEYIDDLLPGNLAPNVLLANPPFSSNGGRTRSNSGKFGFRHIESALRCLGDEGRFGVILGPSGSPRTRSGAEFWGKLGPQIKIQAAIEIDGREYYRNGTSTDVTLIIGRKLGCKGEQYLEETAGKPTLISVSSVEEVFAAADSQNLRL